MIDIESIKPACDTLTVFINNRVTPPDQMSDQASGHQPTDTLAQMLEHSRNQQLIYLQYQQQPLPLEVIAACGVISSMLTKVLYLSNTLTPPATLYTDEGKKGHWVLAANETRYVLDTDSNSPTALTMKEPQQ